MMARRAEAPSSKPFELAGFLPVFRRWWWLLIASAVVSGAIGQLAASQSEPTFESRVQLVVGPINTDLDTQRAAGQLAQLYVELATSRPVLDATIEELALPITATELRANVTATANATTRVLTIRVRDSNPQATQRAATALANNVIELARQDTNRPEGQLAVFDPAQVGEEIGVNTTFVVALAGLAGLFAALTLVLLAEHLRNAARDETELAELAQTRSLGFLDARVGGQPRHPLAVHARPDSSEATFYRRLAAELEFAQGDRAPQTMLVLSVTDQEGAGEVAANLAATFAAVGRSVTLVDASHTETEITSTFGLQGRPGLTDVLRRAAPGDGAEHPLRNSRATTVLGFEILPCGVAQPPESANPERVKSVLAELLERRNLVIINADPIRRSPQTLTWARSVDATVLVASAGRVKRDHVVEAAEALRLVGANLVGTIMTKGSRTIASERTAMRLPTGSARIEGEATTASPSATVDARRPEARVAGEQEARSHRSVT